jgi:hypothetical protein
LTIRRVFLTATTTPPRRLRSQTRTLANHNGEPSGSRPFDRSSQHQLRTESVLPKHGSWEDTRRYKLWIPTSAYASVQLKSLLQLRRRKTRTGFSRPIPCQADIVGDHAEGVYSQLNIPPRIVSQTEHDDSITLRRTAHCWADDGWVSSETNNRCAPLKQLGPGAHSRIPFFLFLNLCKDYVISSFIDRVQCYLLATQRPFWR